jgi:C1A family cysteine protease
MVSTVLLTSLTTALFLASASAYDVKDRFQGWVSDFKVRIENDEHHDHIFANWLVNDEHIKNTNSQNNTYILGHNQFSGLDSEEFSQYLGFSGMLGSRMEHLKEKVDEVKCLTHCVKNYDKSNKLGTVDCVKQCLDDHITVGVASSVNWVEKGGVTPVKNQGQCGSCWSFSTTGALEGAYFVAHGELKSFSEQQLVSCDNRKNGGKDMGCNGGLMDNAFTWIEKNGGLCLETDYPYTSGTSKSAGNCETTCSVVSNSDVVSFVDVKANSDDDMMSALNQQPVSIAIQADQKDFQLYKSGVFSGSCGTQLDHGVLVVGYGTEDGSDYYLVKNSWGTTWGYNGYIKLGRGDEYNKGAGQCGMLMQGSYPTV